MSRTQGMALLGKYLHGSKNQAVVSPQGDLEGWQTSFLDFSNSEDQNLAEFALQAAELCFEQTKSGFFPASDRLKFFTLLRDVFESQSENLSLLIAQEIGKPLSLARVEIQRGLKTLTLSKNLISENPLSSTQTSVRFKPRGPLLAVTPFNFPINLALHKIAPALALGCPVVWKPSPKAYLVSASLFDIFKNAGLPEGFLNLIFCDNGTTLKLAKDPRIKSVSFTGSIPVGWNLRAQIQKPVTLELGGAAPVYVSSKISESHLDVICERITQGAFNNAGQSCISIQSAFCDSVIFEKFKNRLLQKTQDFPWGHPRNPKTFCGPVVDKNAQIRIQKTLSEIESKGLAKRVGQSQNFISSAPELPANATLRMKDPQTRPQLKPDSDCFVAPQIYEISDSQNFEELNFLKEEIFAPVLFLVHHSGGIESWIRQVNKWPARLQLGVFTDDTAEKQLVSDQLEFGGIVINESSSQRDDALPYGGEGDAGLGREGPEWTAKDLLSYPQTLLEYSY